MVRFASVSDLPALAALLLQVQQIHAQGRPDIFRLGGRKYTDEQLKELLRDDTRPVFVHETDGTVNGYLFGILETTLADTTRNARTVFYIDDLCVDATVRGKGIGKSLYEHAVEYANMNGCDSITLNVWELNASARGFYERLGLTPLKTMMEQRLK